jgi:hypothetical protein
MAYGTTEIQPVTTPAAATAPALNAYQPPTVAVTAPTMNTSNTGYVAPPTTSTTNNINAGLLEYDNTAASAGTFDGRQIATPAAANINQATPEFKTADNYLTDGAFVENRVNGLLAEDSVTMQRAKAQGLADAGSRGLQNTTMGATIGQTAMIDKALQIATPDATTQASADMSRQNATYQATRANQDATNTSSLASQAANINSALSAQTAGQSWDSTQLKSVVQGQLNTQTANIEGAKATQAAQNAADARTQTGLLEGASNQQKAAISAELASMESQSAQNLTILQDKLKAANTTTAEQNAAIMQAFTEQQTTIRTTMSNEYNKASSQAQLDAGQRTSLATAMSGMANDYEISIQNVLLDVNLDAAAKNAAITRINNVFDQDMANISSIFGATYTGTTA